METPAEEDKMVAAQFSPPKKKRIFNGGRIKPKSAHSGPIEFMRRHIK